jgi:hypothetical protein
VIPMSSPQMTRMFGLSDSATERSLSRKLDASNRSLTDQGASTDHPIRAIECVHTGGGSWDGASRDAGYFQRRALPVANWPYPRSDAVELSAW